MEDHSKVLNRRINLTFPVQWNELSRSQFLSIASMLLRLRRGQFATTTDLKVALVCIFMNLKWYTLKKNLDFALLTRSGRIVDLFKFTEFITHSNDITIDLIGRIRYRGASYYGPKDRLLNLTIGEFGDADTAYNRAAVDTSKDNLALLAAILYRPQCYSEQHNPKSASFIGDVRVPHQIAAAIERKRVFEKLPEKLLYAVFLQYQGFRNYLTEEFRPVFTGAPSSSKRLGMAHFIIQISGSKFGTEKETRQSNLYAVLKSLDPELQKRSAS